MVAVPGMKTVNIENEGYGDISNVPLKKANAYYVRQRGPGSSDKGAKGILGSLPYVYNMPHFNLIKFDDFLVPDSADNWIQFFGYLDHPFIAGKNPFMKEKLN